MRFDNINANLQENKSFIVVTGIREYDSVDGIISAKESGEAFEAALLKCLETEMSQYDAENIVILGVTNENSYVGADIEVEYVKDGEKETTTIFLIYATTY